MEILIVGVGYVGLVTGACFSEMGHHVTCLDIDQKKISSLQGGKVPFYEPGLQEIVVRNQKEKRLTFTTSYSKGVKGAEACFIAVGTPSKPDGNTDLAQVEKAAVSIAEELGHYCVIVNKSTVPVGTARKLKKAIEQQLQLREIDIPFDLVANPEFLKEGSAVDDCMKPDRIIIGSDSEKATKALQEIYSAFTFNHDRMLVMSLESAELTKYASNAMLAMRISFMNELSLLCEKTGANIQEVRQGMSGDQRIGYHFLYAGAGYGGSCFPKDIKALKALAKKEQCSAVLLDAVQTINENQKRLLGKKVTAYFARKGGVRGKKIAIWGLAFKPNTDDMREAPSLTLIDSLHKEGAELCVYDPIAMENARKCLEDKEGIRFCASEYQAALGADAIVLVTEWKQFRFVNLNTILKKMRGNAFFDGRNQYLVNEMYRKGFHYIGIGTPEPSTHLLKSLRSLEQKKRKSYAHTQLDRAHPFFD